MGSERREEVEARWEREEALRALGQQATPPAVPAPRGSLAAALPPKQRRRQVLLRVGAVVALVAVLAGVGTVSGVAPWARRAGSVTIQRVSIALDRDRLSCAAGAAWSPDGTWIAVLAEQGDCNAQGGVGTLPRVVALYDLRGNLARELMPDTLTLGHAAPTVGTATPAPPPGASGVAVAAHYSGLSWSPDGTQLALGYQVEENDPKVGHPELRDLGVALLRVDGTGGTLLHQPRDSNSKVWNTQTGAATGEDTLALPPTLSYTWAADGRLAVGALDAAGQAGAVGTPSGGQSFTIWQPGVITYDPQSGALSFSTGFMPWAPDGQFVGAEMALAFFLTASGPALQPAAQGLASITFRDAAMRQVASDLKANVVSGAGAGAPLAWRADGRRLAAVVPEKTLMEAQQRRVAPFAPEHVAIYDCASGRQLGTLATTKITNRSASAFSASQVIWSPDGRRVLLLDTAYGMLTIWGPVGLPV